MTPANIALATDLGILPTKAPSAGHKPVSARSKPAMSTPPIALLNPIPDKDDPAIRAAPGVHHTIDSGILNFQLNTIDKRP